MVWLILIFLLPSIPTSLDLSGNTVGRVEMDDLHLFALAIYEISEILVIK